MDIFAQFLAEAESELELLRLAAECAPSAVSANGAADATNDAKRLLRATIAEQEAFVERMRTYCGAPDGRRPASKGAASRHHQA